MNKTVTLSCTNVEPKDFDRVFKIMQEAWANVCRQFKEGDGVKVKLDFINEQPNETRHQ